MRFNKLTYAAGKKMGNHFKKHDKLNMVISLKNRQPSNLFPRQIFCSYSSNLTYSEYKELT